MADLVAKSSGYTTIFSTLLILIFCGLVLFANFLALDGRLATFSHAQGDNTLGSKIRVGGFAMDSVLVYAPLLPALYLLLVARSPRKPNPYSVMLIITSICWMALIGYTLYWYFMIDFFLQGALDPNHTYVPLLRYIPSFIVQSGTGNPANYFPLMFLVAPGGFFFYLNIGAQLAWFVALSSIRKKFTLESYLIWIVGITLLVVFGTLAYGLVRSGLYLERGFTLIELGTFFFFSISLLYVLSPKRK